MNLIAGIAQQIGIAIGESVASHMESKLHSRVGPDVAGDTSSSGGAGPSLVNFVVKSDIKEPVCFKGNDSDTCTVHEWETVLMSYLWKIGTPVTEQAEEVISRLRGMAREVVRVVMRSNPSLDLSSGPGPVFDLHEKLVEHKRDRKYSPRLEIAPAIASLRQEVSSTTHPTMAAGVHDREAVSAPNSNQATRVRWAIRAHHCYVGAHS